MSDSAKEPKQLAGQRPTAACPICGKPRSHEHRPFCSAPCRDRDLLNWLDGRYAIPAIESEPDEAESAPERG